MTASDLFARVNRAQRTLLFKLVATALILLLDVGFLINYAYEQAKAERDAPHVSVIAREPETPANETGPKPDSVSPERRATARAEAELDAQYINDIVSRRADWAGVAIVAVLVSAVLLGFVWLGLGAIAPFLLGLVALVAWRLKLFSPQDVGFEELRTFDVVLLFIAAVAILTCSFLLLMEVLKLLFGRSTPVLAVARNVVNEAVRLRVSLVLIVLLIFGLAAMPGLLDPGTPLRYRVQSFLEYGTGGAFWIIAVLVLFLSVGSVTFEQRDRVIWQTMTKPVAAWEYLLGKWLGVVGVAAVLLLVSGSGVFAFTEYLSRQKAMGEIRPYVAEGTQFVSEDRIVLESQVLAARRTIRPTLPQLTQDEVDRAVVEQIAKELHQEGVGVNEQSVAERSTPEVIARIRGELGQQVRDKFRAIEPGASQLYQFDGLGALRRIHWESAASAARRLKMSVEDVQAQAEHGNLLSRTVNDRLEIGRAEAGSATLRYKIQAGGNDPRTTFHVSFQLAGHRDSRVVEVPLNTMMTLQIPPSAIDENGRLELSVTNGDIVNREANPATLTLPADGFSINYSAGSYRINFFRVILILWLKLAFLAMVAITASTFLSFPVASMIAFGVLLIAEGASFVWEALNYYDATVEGHLVFHRLVIRAISLPIAWTFKHYSEIMPIQGLTDGQLISWEIVLWSVILLGGTSALLYALGVVIFRRRELATYSGQ